MNYIFFDLDGTLTDPKLGITRAFQYALGKMGIIVEDANTLSRFIGPPLRDSFRGYGFGEEAVERAVAYYREYFAETGLFENTVYDGIPELLSALKAAGKTLLIATSKPVVYTEKILEHFGLAEYFAFVSGAELDGTRSIKAEVIAYAMEQAGIKDVSDCVMVGDREHDIIGAKAHGMRSVGVLYGYGDRAEHERAGADEIAADVGELRGLLK